MIFRIRKRLKIFQSYRLDRVNRLIGFQVLHEVPCIVGRRLVVLFQILPHDIFLLLQPAALQQRLRRDEVGRERVGVGREARRRAPI